MDGATTNWFRDLLSSAGRSRLCKESRCPNSDREAIRKMVTDGRWVGAHQGATALGAVDRLGYSYHRWPARQGVANTRRLHPGQLDSCKQRCLGIETPSPLLREGHG